MTNEENSPMDYMRIIPKRERRSWRPLKEGLALQILDTFLHSDMDMVEVKLEKLPEPVHKEGTTRSTKQDSFASSFYAWKKKKQTQVTLTKMGIEILLIRRGGKVALKKRLWRKKK